MSRYYMDIAHKGLKTIPTRFLETEQYANFYGEHNELTSLIGSPKIINGIRSYGDYHCYYNLLNSLYGCSKFVSGCFRCSNNKLFSLDFLSLYCGIISKSF